tara:strand:+ start:20814 stop:21041 length:228 start_codon:yes stop_codon:yes gene_type:complete
MTHHRHHAVSPAFQAHCGAIASFNTGLRRIAAAWHTQEGKACHQLGGSGDKIALIGGADAKTVLPPHQTESASKD